MGIAVKYVQSLSESQITTLTSTDALWYDLGFYYPNDTPVKTYYYRVVNGMMVKYAAGDTTSIGDGITLNDKVIGGVKTLIETNDILNIPENWDYNTFSLDVEGVINVEGQINTL